MREEEKRNIVDRWPSEVVTNLRLFGTRRMRLFAVSLKSGHPLKPRENEINEEVST